MRVTLMVFNSILVVIGVLMAIFANNSLTMWLGIGLALVNAITLIYHFVKGRERSQP